MRPVADFVSSFIFYSVPLGDAELPLIVVWLIAGGVFFTVYLGFVNVRGFRHACSLLTGIMSSDTGSLSAPPPPRWIAASIS